VLIALLAVACTRSHLAQSWDAASADAAVDATVSAPTMTSQAIDGFTAAQGRVQGSRFRLEGKLTRSTSQLRGQRFALRIAAH
jgi:hypothetical protein